MSAGFIPAADFFPFQGAAASADEPLMNITEATE